MTTTITQGERSAAVDDLLIDEAGAQALRTASLAFPSLTLTKRQLCDLELLLNGGFSPLRGFMDRAAYDSVVSDCRLSDGSLWPIPVVLDVDAGFAEKLSPGQKIALRDAEGFMPAVLTVGEVWEADKAREALWHAIVNRNFGATHFIVGPDHASPPVNGAGSFYPKYAAQELAVARAAELGIEIVPLPEHRYVPAKGTFLPDTQIAEQGLEGAEIGRGELREMLLHGREVPEWFSYPEVLGALAKVYPPRSRQGITLFFTGLSGSGKSTLANIVFAKLIEGGGRPVSLLDGDIVRQNLSSELGFSKAHRDINIRRIGFVASEITKNGGVAICAPIAPYRETRRAVRELIEEHGAFIEIHVSTPLDVCEERDRKGLYAKARKGIIPEFTGISDPYDDPERPELRIDTSVLAPAEAAQEILLYLFKEGYLDEEG